MPIHNIRRGSSMLYMYKIDVGCSLKWFTASAQIKWYCFKTSMTHVIRQQFSKIGENIVVVMDGVMIYLYDQAKNQEKYNKTLNVKKIDVGRSLEWFYSLNTRVEVSFTQVHHLAFQPAH